MRITEAITKIAGVSFTNCRRFFLEDSTISRNLPTNRIYLQKQTV